jgi:hypothetical protein
MAGLDAPRITNSMKRILQYIAQEPILEITIMIIIFAIIITLTGCQTPQPDPERPPVEYSER